MKSLRIPSRVVPGIAALLILILQSTPAQTPAEQTAPPTTTIKVSTRLVTVGVVAQDSKGQPVQGLTKDDFELRDDGKLQTISVFSVEGQAAPAAGALLAPLPPGTFTNRPSRPSEFPGSATVILLDGLNTSPADLALARGEVAKFLRQLQPQDRVALYSMGKDLRIIQDFTNNPSLISKALEGMHAERNAPAGPQLSTLLPPDRSVVNLSFLMAPQIVGMTLRGFEAIGQHLADVPGRKNLIWISNGFTLTSTAPSPIAVDTTGKKHLNTPEPNENVFVPQIQQACRVLGKYNVAVYPIDARGLLQGMNVMGAVIKPMQAAVKEMDRTHDSGYMLADLTGGRALYNTNDISAGIRSAIDDSRLVYVLGYYPAQKKVDSKFHTIKVRVERPGVKLLYRTGYLAAPEEQNPNPADAESSLGRAVLSPLDSTAIGLRARLQKTGTGGQPVTIDLRIDVNDLALNHNEDRWKGNLEVIIAQRTSTGQSPADSARKHSVNLSLKEDYYTQLKTAGLELFFPVTPDPQAVDLRVVVRDVSSGAMGTVDIPLIKTAGE
jgi:VWFA-related protein